MIRVRYSTREVCIGYARWAKLSLTEACQTAGVHWHAEP